MDEVGHFGHVYETTWEDVNTWVVDSEAGNDLFSQIKVDVGGYGISWDDSLDLDVYLLYSKSDRLILSYALFFLASGCGSKPMIVICCCSGPYTQNILIAPLFLFSR